jgi:hypothetical protein
MCCARPTPSEKVLCRLRMPARTEHKIEGLTLRIHGPMGVVPLLLNPNIPLIHTVQVVGRPQIRTTPPVQLRRVVLDPAKHRGVVDPYPALPQKLFNVVVAQRLAQMPLHGAKDDVALKVEPFEQEDHS